MDLQERHQLDAARQHAAKVKARARPWRAIVALVLAVIAATVSIQARHTAALFELPVQDRGTTWLSPLGRTGNLVLAYGAAVVFFLLASAATIGLANKAREILLPSLGYAHAAVVRFAIVVAGCVATILITLQLFDIAVTQLIVGGAVTGVILGIAAQQSLANLFSGIILLSARPFRVGDRIGIRSGALSGLIEGTVTEISLTYVLLETTNGPVHVPNSQVLAAAVGPAGAVPPPPGQGPPPAGAAHHQAARRRRATGRHRRAGRKHRRAGRKHRRAASKHRPAAAPRTQERPRWPAPPPRRQVPQRLRRRIRARSPPSTTPAVSLPEQRRSGPGGSAVARLVLRDDLRRNPAAVADRDAVPLRPGPDLGAVPAVSRRSALSARDPAGHLARPVRELPEHLIELLAVRLA